LLRLKEEAPVTTELEPIELPILPDEPLVSVLVSNYNYARFVGDALESALRQTYERIEIVVCDDGSTDDSCSVIEKIADKDSRLTLIRKSNGGQASAFNASFREASGEIICFLDSDDLWSTSKVESIVDSFRTSNQGLALHKMVIVDASMRELQQIPTFTRQENGWIANKVLARGGRWRWMPSSAIAMRREILDRILPMPEARFRSDADTFILMLAPLMTEIKNLPLVLGSYRLHGSNAFAGKDMDARAATRTLEALTIGIEEVNLRLAEMGLEHVKIDSRKNIKIAEQEFLRDAFEGRSRRSLAKQYIALAAKLREDDLYSGAQKAWACLMFGLIIPLPLRYRLRWASLNLGTSRLREFVRRIQQRELRSGGQE